MNWEGGINFVGGGQKVTEYKYNTSTTETDVYYIKDGDYYLNFNGDGITSQGTPTKWYRGIGEFSGAIYTVTDKKIYFLTINNGNLDVLTEREVDVLNLPEWDFSSGTLSFNGAPIECNNGTWQIATTTYLISSGSNYLSVNVNVNGTDISISNGTSGDAVSWSLSDGTNGGTISTSINGTPHYLRYSNYSLSLTTNSTQATSWTYSNNRLSASNRYLRYSGGSWQTTSWSSQASTITLTGVWDEAFAVAFENAGTASSVVFETREYIDNSVTNDYYDENGERKPTGAVGISYLPLSKNKDGYTVASSNTGYIVGAEWGALEKGEGHDANDANIRISAYNTDNIKNPSTPYTMTYKTEGKFKIISDTDATTVNTLGLQKYTQALLDDYTGSIETYCYGLHFMEASVSKSNKTKITATLKGETHTDYQVPTNCIDFHLYDSGFINFVAGSYYDQSGSTNNSFFSLYEIVRDPNDEKIIIDIKEICKIYATKLANGDIDTTKPYYYTYLVDGTETGTEDIPSGYEMVFDCKWITHPDSKSYYEGNASPNPTEWTLDSAYYFEVPVNAGEYAIGSTKGRTGAYLIYLDLAANAQTLNRTQTIEKITTEKSSISMPTGVAILETKGESVNPLNNAFVSIASGYGGAGGEISFTKAGENITQSANSDAVKAEFVGEGTTLLDGAGEKMHPPNTALTVLETTVVERITWEDFNISTQQEELTVVTTRKTVTNAQGTTSTVEVTVGGESANSGGYDFEDTNNTLPTMTKYIEIAYLESDAVVTIEYKPLVTIEGETSTLTGYTITITSDKDVVLSAVLLGDGVDVTVNGVTLTQAKQNISVKATTS